MRYLRLALLPLLLVACTDTQTPIDQQPSFDFSNGPAEPGNSYIVRGDWGGFDFFFIDARTELAVYVTDDDFDCVDFEGATLIPFQQIFNPSGEGLLMYHEAGWLNAVILEPPYECDDDLATGLVHNTWVDNDVRAWLYEHNRANAYGGVINGRVGDYSVSWVMRVMWGGSTKPDHTFVFNEHITIK